MLVTLEEMEQFDDSRMVNSSHYLHLFEDIRTLLISFLLQICGQRTIGDDDRQSPNSRKAVWTLADQPDLWSTITRCDQDERDI